MNTINAIGVYIATAWIEVKKSNAQSTRVGAHFVNERTTRSWGNDDVTDSGPMSCIQ